MRLLTHNTLRCNRKDVIDGFPLTIRGAKCEIRESEPDAEFVQHMLPTLHWPALHGAAAAVGFDLLPPSAEAAAKLLAEDPAFVKVLHTVLMDLHVLEGTLVCPESGQEFPITDGIPNMILPDSAT